MPEDQDQPNAYQLLGVAEGASTGEIARARKALLYQLHPDRLGALSEAERAASEERFKQVEAAFAQVKSKRRRWHYNEHLRQERARRAHRQAQEGPSPWPPVRSAGRPAPRPGLRVWRWALAGALVVAACAALAYARRPRPPVEDPAPLAEAVSLRPVAQEAAPQQPAPQGPPSPGSWRRPGDGSYDLVERTAALYGLPTALLEAVIAAESGGDPAHRGPEGRVGLLGLPPDPIAGSPGDLTDPGTNLLEGGLVLRDLVDAHGGDLSLALAAWRRGPQEVAWRRGVPADADTTRYLRKALAGYVEAQAARGAALPRRAPVPDGAAGAAPLLEGSFRNVSFGWTAPVVERALVPSRRGLAWESHTCLFYALDLAGRSLEALAAPAPLRSRTLFDVDDAWGEVVAWYANGRLVALQAASKSPQQKLLADLAEAWGGQPFAATFSARWGAFSRDRETWCWRAPGLTACVLAAEGRANRTERARPLLWLTSDKAEAAVRAGVGGR